MKITRPQELSKNIAVIDGFSCAGKSLIAPVISSLQNSELWRFNYPLEYLTLSHGLGRIPDDAAESLIKALFDQMLYDSMLGRDTNFRASDDSSVKYNLQEAEYIYRLPIEDGDNVVSQIEEQKPISSVMTHFNFQHSDIVFTALGDRLKLYLIAVRHPAHLISAWFLGSREKSWSERFGKDPREFTLCAEVDGSVVPWFAADWAEKYLSLSPFEQSAHMICRLMKRLNEWHKGLNFKDKEKVFFVPFEDYVLRPEVYTKYISDALNTGPSPLTQKIFEKLSLPRSANSEDLDTSKQKKQLDALMGFRSISDETRAMLEFTFKKYEDFLAENEALL